MPKPRRILLLVLVAFVIYAMMKSPGHSADLVRSALGQLGNGVRAVGQFFDALLQK